MFPVVSREVQRAYEQTIMMHEVPEICGFCGRACRQMGKEEGANRFLCMGCSLAEFAKRT